MILPNDIQFRKGWGGNATSTDGANVAMQIRDDGRVGIGPDFNDVTLSPQGRLHVVGEGTATEKNIYVN